MVAGIAWFSGLKSFETALFGEYGGAGLSYLKRVVQRDSNDLGDQMLGELLSFACEGGLGSYRAASEKDVRQLLEGNPTYFDRDVPFHWPIATSAAIATNADQGSSSALGAVHESHGRKFARGTRFLLAARTGPK